MSHPKQQHYVPQLLLRGFATEDKEQLHALDKRSGKVFQTSIRNVATQKGFYDLKTEIGIETLEPGLGRLESEVAPLIARIRAEESIAFLRDVDREMIALFAMVQHQRTTNYREKVAKMNRDLLAKIRRMGFDTTPMDGMKEFSDGDVQRFAMQSIGMAVQFVPHILDKAWLLLGSSAEDPFYLGDNPVTLQNRKDFGLYGNIGFAVPGIEIYLPLSNRLCLAWFSSSFVAEFTEGIQTAERLRVALPSEHAKLDESVLRLKEFLDAARDGTVQRCKADNVININAMQVRQSERYVFTLGGDFAFALKVLEENPHWRQGPRGTVS